MLSTALPLILATMALAAPTPQQGTPDATAPTLEFTSVPSEIRNCESAYFEWKHGQGPYQLFVGDQWVQTDDNSATIIVHSDIGDNVEAYVRDSTYAPTAHRKYTVNDGIFAGKCGRSVDQGSPDIAMPKQNDEPLATTSNGKRSPPAADWLHAEAEALAQYNNSKPAIEAYKEVAAKYGRHQLARVTRGKSLEDLKARDDSTEQLDQPHFSEPVDKAKTLSGGQDNNQDNNGDAGVVDTQQQAIRAFSEAGSREGTAGPPMGYKKGRNE